MNTPIDSRKLFGFRMMGCCWSLSPCKENSMEWVKTDRFQTSESITVCADLISKKTPVKLSLYLYEITAGESGFFIQAGSQEFQDGLIVFPLSAQLRPGRYRFQIRWDGNQVGDGEFIVLGS